MGGLIWWIIVGLIAGWTTGRLMSGEGYGTGFDIALGILGALIGGYIMASLGLIGAGGLVYSILVATLGACLLVALVRLFTRRRLV